jgi:hypothetical protein
MSDDHVKQNLTDPQTIFPEDDLEVVAFAERHSLPREAAIKIIKAAHGNRIAADEAAKNYTARA